ncbi:hypothetical protein F3J23_03580 [Chryseobacterium sp. Tr-659]|uniref:hypothetical protein n=1 Tax=Chryseobacterium sp. Tr-659 TaxID=2608340 RepID=UPI0014239001|nr:hypothetical protein [Chryseobacterium sp. Tr-659]NIF04512.1 hypothetical protein [Chryseobacterium sp. Tr-659]
MKLNIIFSIVLLAGLTACTSKEATDFKKKVTDKEQMVFKALIDDHGYETEKSKSLIKRDFDGALTSIDKEEKLFDSVIKDLSALPVDQIKEGALVKTAAIGYYTTLKDLFLLDRESIQQQKITFTKDAQKVDKANDSILQITKKKVELHKIADTKSQNLQKALAAFDQANNIK